jgi:organic hydroperoxide reductase OsmC/OhrA
MTGTYGITTTPLTFQAPGAASCFSGARHHVLSRRADVIFSSSQDEPRIFVESEDKPVRVLLETKISKDGGYQKQQGSRFVIRLLPCCAIR